jgi:oxygen-independent coproporphyrinogen-3 oxidase
MSTVREFTVEAGRPDTIDADKLLAIKQNGVTRISINPQTMNDSVLSTIGRRHTARDTIDAFNLAREIGFDNINMDLIAGLPTDTFDSFKNTLVEILKLDPESVTVHSLSMKRASTLNTSGQHSEIGEGAEASKMVNFARDILARNGILPYYMYRQSKTVGNLENVGYAKSGFEGLYNVYIMDETHTILACGASAVTKLKDNSQKNIKRIFNFKYPYEYISGFEEQLSRKTEIGEFYDKYFKRD